jgi:tetratricopeptide (TPR) repeat protein
MRTLSSRSVAALALLGLLAGTPGCGAAAGPATPPAVADRPEPAEDLFRKGREAAARGDALRAEQYLALSLEQGYDRGKVVRALVEVCVKGSRLRAALLHAEPYLRDHPDDHELRYLIATIHWALGELDLARRQLDLLVRLNPNTAAAHYLLGVLDGESNPTRAVGHFERYLAVEPRGSRAPEVRGRLAELRLDLESPDSARKEQP